MAEATTAARATAGSRPETHAATHPAAAAARDYARDAVTAFLLVASLFMPWVASAPHGQVATGIAAAHIDVLLVTMVTLVALAIPHLGRVPALGTAWSPDTVRRVRLVIGLPYAVLVIVYLVLALVTQLTLGPALAFGMAGAILAVQPRQRELPPVPRAGRVWLRGTVVVAGLAVVFTLVQIAEMFSIFSANGPAAFILSIVLGLAASGILAVAAVGALTGHRAWRRIGIGLGVAAAVLILLSLNPQLVLVDATLHGPAPTFSLMFWVAFGAAAAAPALGRRLPAVADAGAAWFAVVRVILGLAVSCGILVVIVSSIELSYEQLIGPFAPLAVTEWMIALAVGVLLTAGGVTVWAISRTKTRSAVEAISVFAGILFVLGLILTVVWSLPSALPFGGAATLAPLIAFAFPAALLGCLWVPASSRARYASLPHGGRSRVSSAEQGRAGDDVARTGATKYHDDATQSDDGTSPTLPYAAAADAAGQTKARRGTQGGANGTKRAESVEDRAGGAAAGRGPAPERDPKDVLAEAADPATPASRLHELAGAAPYARAALAGNPSTYPALVEWLGRLGDPEVNAALARRAASPADDATTPGGDESA